MKSLLRWQILVPVILVVVAGWLFSTYNGLVSSKGAVDGAWAQVQTQYQRRFDLVPNLQQIVKGSANFEATTLKEVTEARTKWMSAGADRTQQLAAAQSFDGALSRLLVTVEAYPQLQSTAAFRDFMTQLEGTENRVSVARKDFNDAVMAYNVKVRMLPTSLVAGMLGFGPQDYFQAVAGSENAPKVAF